MKTAGLFVILMSVLAAAICFAAPEANSGTPKVIRVVMDDNYPPYVFKNAQGKLQGILVDQWKLWEEKTGITAELTGMDWGEAQRRMLAGEFDVIDTIFKTVKREAVLDFSTPYAKIDFSIFLHNDISGIRDASDLKGFVVGVKSGGAVIDALKQRGIENIIPFSDDQAIVEAARDAKINVFVMGHNSALYFLNRMNIADKYRHTAPLFSGEFHRAVMKGNSGLLTTVENGFAALEKSHLAAVDERWMGSPISSIPYFRYLLYAVSATGFLLIVLFLWLRTLRKMVADKTDELARSQMLFSLFMRYSPVYVFIKEVTPTSSRVLQASENFEGMVGIKGSDMIGKTMEELFPPDFAAKITADDQAVVAHGEVLKIDEDLHGRNYTTIKFPLVEGDRTLLAGFTIDITERKLAEADRLNLEKQLLHAQKLESLGVLAGGIAHDFNNILTAIIGNADLALMRINKESPAVDNLHRIEQAASRAADLARQMLAYSGKGKFVIERIDLNMLLQEMLHMLEVSISKNAVLRLTPHTPLPSVEVDATQIRQIIMNLVINASEAIGDKSGVIAITTGSMMCDTKYLMDVWLDENIPAGHYVFLEIADSGCGMDKATMARLFDPFFTTKFTGRGLGMAAVLGIVRGHKGAIKVYSEPNKGTTFRILLPASERPPDLPTTKIQTDHWTGGGKVLLVDDEETVREIGREMLQELGFTVITAENGTEGIAAFRQNPDIVFAILDLTMPHMDGEECFRELKQLKPDLKVMISSGYSEQEVSLKFVGRGLAGFIQKPYKMSALSEAVRKIV